MWRKYFFVQEICDSIIAHKYFFKFQFERMIETHSSARSRTLILDSCDCARYIEKDMKMGTNIHLYVLYGIKYACRQKRCTLSLRMPLQIEWLQCAVCMFVWNTHVKRYRSKFTFLVDVRLLSPSSDIRTILSKLSVGVWYWSQSSNLHQCNVSNQVFVSIV